MKNALIVSGVYELFLTRKKELYLNKEDCNNLELYKDAIGDKNQLIECQKIYNANRQRKRNNWTEICKWLYMKFYYAPYQSYNLVFGTLTFNEETLKKTNGTTRKKYITRYLSEETIHYVANIDFGKINNREHYHFIALVKDKMNCKNWGYGGNKIKKIKLTKEDLKRVKNYVLKLNNHSYKSSTKQARIIRDRNQDSMDFITEVLAPNDFKRFKEKLNAR